MSRAQFQHHFTKVTKAAGRVPTIDAEAWVLTLEFYRLLGLPAGLIAGNPSHSEAIFELALLLQKDQTAIHGDGSTSSVWRQRLLARDPDFAYNLKLAGPETSH